LDVNAKWSSELLGKKLLLDVLAGWHHERDQILASDGSGPQSPTGLATRSHVTWLRGDESTSPHGIADFETLPDPSRCDPRDSATVVLCPVNTYASGGPGDLRIKTFDRYQAAATVSYLMTGLGHHVLKAGVDTEVTEFQHLKSISGGRFLEESSDGKTFLQAWGYGLLTGPDQPRFLAVYPTHSRSLSVGGFLQDSWSVLDKVTVNAGLRYDTQLLYANSGRLGLALPNEWSPRLGLIYDFTQDGRSKVFVSYARYYQTVALDVADVTLSGDPHLRATIDATRCDPRVRAMDVGANAACRNSYLAGGAGLPNQVWTQIGGGQTVVDPALRPPSSDELTVGLEYDLLADHRVGVGYDRRWLHDWMEDMSLDEMQSWIYGNPGQGIAGGFPAASRAYDALTLFWTKSFSREWLAQASYTLAYLRGNVQGLFSKGSDLAPNHLGDFDLARIEANRVGPLPGDQRHAFKLFGARDWPLAIGHRLATGLALRAHSGGPTNVLGKDPVAGEGSTFVLPRGAGARLPWQFSIDLQIGYRLAVGRRSTVSLTIDAFNVLDFQAATDRDETYTYNDVLAIPHGTPASLGRLRTVAGQSVEVNPSFGAPTIFQPPRTVRFGLRGDF
jgi:outer membrane receptor protein involved in Fe transport